MGLQNDRAHSKAAEHNSPPVIGDAHHYRLDTAGDARFIYFMRVRINFGSLHNSCLNRTIPAADTQPVLYRGDAWTQSDVMPIKKHRYAQVKHTLVPVVRALRCFKRFARICRHRVVVRLPVSLPL